MKNKRLLLLTILMALSMFIVACGGDTEDASTEANTNEANNGANNDAEANNSDEAATGEYNIQIGYVNAEDSPVDQGANKFKELIEERTDGQVTVDIFPNSQLGGERDMLEGMEVGTIDMVITGDAAFGMFAPEYEGLSLPFLVADTDHLDRVVYGEIGDEISEAFLASLNSRTLDFWHRGPRNLTANEEKLTPDDLDGMRLRVPEIPLIVESWSALGANPTPMAFDELFVSLQQGIVDGQENPLDLIYTSNFYEVQSHVMLTEHLVAPFIILMNNDKLESFPEDIQTHIEEAITEAGEYQKQVVRETEEEYKELLAENGMEVVEVDQEAFRQKLEDAGIVEQFEDDWAPNLIERIQELE